MEKLFTDLLGIITLALPTVALVIVLHWFLKKVLFQPMERVLEERYRRTEGAVEASQAALATVKEKMAKYEKALGDARGEIFKESEAARKALADQQSKAVAAARLKSSEQVAAAKADLNKQAEEARASLRSEAEALAEQITGALLTGGVQ